MLDGLHEDLNRVKNKKVTKSIESNGRKDYIVAKESWMNYLKRNNSIISDLMVGQLKSRLDCPKCSKVSITFDPFLSLLLSIPRKEVNEIELYYIPADSRNKPQKITISYNVKTHTVDDLL